MVLRGVRADTWEGVIVLKLATSNENPMPAEIGLRAMVRDEIAESGESHLTPSVVADAVLRKTGADMGALVTHGARLYLTGLARDELARSPRHARIDGGENE